MAENFKDEEKRDPNENGGEVYDEAFILRAVAIAHARSWSNQAIAASLCIPADLLEEWLRDYSGKVEVRYLEDKRFKGSRASRPFRSRQDGFEDGQKLARCPGCDSDVVFNPVKSFEVQRENGVDIGTHDSIMDSGDDGIYGIEIPYVRITTEQIARCPACGLYTIQNVTEKLTHSEA